MQNKIVSIFYELLILLIGFSQPGIICQTDVLTLAHLLTAVRTKILAKNIHSMKAHKIAKSELTKNSRWTNPAGRVTVVECSNKYYLLHLSIIQLKCYGFI